MLKFVMAALAVLAAPVAALAQVPPFPASFRTQDIATDGATIHVRVGGQGPAVVLLHGYGETGDMWAPLAADLARDHTVVVPDLRGIGLSSRPAGGYDKKTQAGDVAGVLDALEHRAAPTSSPTTSATWSPTPSPRSIPSASTRLVVIDAPLPGIGPWEEILKNPLLWHFRFGGPDMERLVAGRERIYLDRFWNEFSATPARFTRSRRASTTPRSTPCPAPCTPASRSSPPSTRTPIDNRAFLADRASSTMPVLAVGGEKSFGPTMADGDALRRQRRAPRASCPDSGHWIMEENPAATVAMVRAFLDASN